MSAKSQNSNNEEKDAIAQHTTEKVAEGLDASEGSSSESSDDSDSDDSDESEVDITERTDIPENLKPQVDRLRVLRERLAQSAQDNKREVYKEHQRLCENPGDQRRQDRKRREAEILQKRDEYTGNDYERTRFLDYTIEQVEKYEKKKGKGRDNVERGFTDYSQVNQRKYERDVAKLKPDLALYQRVTVEASSSAVILGEQHKPERRKVEMLAKAVEEQQNKRAKLHKPSIEKEGEDVSYINDRNARFNRKMNRAYDKHTKEIRDNFERGTAL